MSRFDLSIRGFTRPDFPPVPENISPADARSPLIPSSIAATSSLYITIHLPFARDSQNPLFPATHLQLVYDYEGTGQTFIPDLITAQRLVQVGSDANVYEIEVPPKNVARAKVNHGTTNTATVLLYAWKREKLLGKWTAGEIEGLGIEGLKSTALSLSRVESWRAAQKAEDEKRH